MARMGARGAASEELGGDITQEAVPTLECQDCRHNDTRDDGGDWHRGSLLATERN